MKEFKDSALEKNAGKFSGSSNSVCRLDFFCAAEQFLTVEICR
jgi:hypothetical protein